MFSSTHFSHAEGTLGGREPDAGKPLVEGGGGGAGGATRAVEGGGAWCRPRSLSPRGDPAEHEVRVGHRGFGAAPPV